MQFFVGIDVSLDSSSICVIDERGVIIKEGKTDSDPAAIARFVRHKGRKIEHVGLETGSLSQWLHAGLSREGFRVTVMEARHVRAAFAAMRVKTDRNDARGIAQLVRLGWFKAVHVKAPSAQETRTLLNGRRFLVDKLTGIENSMRASLRNFGLKMGQVTRSKWAARARELAVGIPALELVIESLLRVRDALRQELRAIDRRLLDEAKADPVVRMLMTAPGVGAVVALTFKSAVDDPTRFKRVRDVGPWLGLTPTVPIRSDRHCRPHHQGGRRRRAHGAVRGGHHAAQSRDKMVDHQELGHAGRASEWREEGSRGPRSQARHRAAHHVAVPDALPLGSNRGIRITTGG